MSSSGINTLTTGTINGLNSLALDELTTTTMNAATIDGGIIYYNKIEGNEIIVDTKLTLTNTGVIAVGDKFISDIELTYLDGVSSNIQTQINNIANQESNVQSQIDTHTSQITSLQATDVTHSNQIGYLQDETADLYNSEAMFIAQITVLQNKTQYISSTAFSTTMSKALYITGTDALRLYGNHSYLSGWSTTTNNRDWVIGTPNVNDKKLLIKNEKLEGIYLQTGSRTGNTKLGQNKIFTYSNGISLKRGGLTAGDTEITVGEIGALTDGNLRINGTSTNNIILSSGIGEISCESNLLRVGATTANANGRKSNILMYDTTGNNLETQSSAFTETLKSQISTNTSNITILQTSNSSLNSSIALLQTSDTAQNTAITNLQTSDTAQNTAITNLQTSDTAQNTAITNLQTSDTSQNTIITQLQSKTQNISSATTLQTNMNKPLFITGVDALRVYGNHSFISGWSTSTNNRDWYFGTENANVKRFVFQNEKEDGIYLRTGSRSGNAFFGQNKIITHSNGISLRRGGLTGDALVTVGEIGAINTTNANLYVNGNGTNNIIVESGLGAISLVTLSKINTSSTGIVFNRNLPTYYSGGEIGLLNSNNNTFHIVSNGTNDIYMSSGAGNMTLLTTAGMFLNSNIVWIGSGIANANGRKSNINMLDATGNNWETQSSAFTEVHKSKINSMIDSASFGNSKGLISFTQAYWWLQLPLNTTSIPNFNTSIGSASRTVGEYFNAFGYNNYFDAGGVYIYSTPSNFNLTFEMEFNTKTMTAFKELKSKIAIYSGATLITETQYQGISYNNYNSNHASIIYKVGPFKHIISSGQKILLFTNYNFQTGNDGTTLTMNGKFTIEKNVL